MDDSQIALANVSAVNPLSQDEIEEFPNGDHAGVVVTESQLTIDRDPSTGCIVANVRQRTLGLVETENGSAFIFSEQSRTAVIEPADSPVDQEASPPPATATDVYSLEAAGVDVDDDDPEACECGEKCCKISESCCEGCIRCCEKFTSGFGFASVVNVELLRRAARKGRKKIRRKVFPLFSVYGLEVWSYLLFLFTLFSATRSVVFFMLHENKTIVDYVDIGFSGGSWILSVLNFVTATYLYRCGIAFCLYKCCCDGEISFKERKDKGFCCEFTDLFRLLLSDLLVYPITMCSMFELFLGILSTEEYTIDIRDLVLFVIQVVQNIVLIYGTRCIVILRSIHNLHQARKGGELASSAQWFHTHFFLHVLGQILVQVLMIVCIGAKFFDENINFLDDNTVRISPFLWYMIASGLVFPFVGVLTFAIGNYYFVQEYPIEFLLDIYTVAKRQALEKKDVEKIEKEFTKIHETKEEFDKIRNNKCFLLKYVNVFVNPVLIIISVVYTLLLSIASCCVLLNYSPETGFRYGWIPFGSFDWAVFFMVAAGLISLANIQVILIPLVWIAILSLVGAVLVLIAFVIIVIGSFVMFIVSILIDLLPIIAIIACCCFCLCLSKESDD